MTSLEDLQGRTWFTTHQAAAYTGHHPKTIQHALQAGELTGSQRVSRGRWRIHIDDLDRWVRGDRDDEEVRNET